MCPYFYLLNARRDFFIDWQATHEYHSKHCMAWLITIWLYFPISCQDDKIENRYSPSPDLLAMSSHVTLQISISEMAHGMQFCRKVQKTDHHPKARLLTYVALFFKNDWPCFHAFSSSLWHTEIKLLHFPHPTPLLYCRARKGSTRASETY